MRRNLPSAAAAAIGIAIMLAGCSLLNPGPPRDGDGRVSESMTISARDLVEGDCFTFNSADGGIVAEVTVMPCSLAHDYIVIGQGVLSAPIIASAGSLQNAVSISCSRHFDAFKAGVESETKPRQEFLVFAESEQSDSDQLYSCIATDPDQSAIESAPEP